MYFSFSHIVVFCQVLSNLFLQHWVHNHVPQRYRPLDSEVVIVSVLVAKVDLKLLPDPPERTFILSWVAELTEVMVDGPSSVNFIEFALNLCKSKAELHESLIGLEYLKCLLKYLPGPCDPVELSSLCDIHIDAFILFWSWFHIFDSSFVDSHGV